MTWLYENKVFDLSEEELEKYQGFVYEVEECDTGMKYIGKKFFWKKKVLPKNQSRKRKIITRVQSDWKDYHGSNDQVKQLREEGKLFKRKNIILMQNERRMFLL